MLFSCSMRPTLPTVAGVGNRTTRPGSCLVLASGGVDSTTLLCLCVERGTEPGALFIDHGQAAAQSENAAVARLSSHLGLSYRRVRYNGSKFGSGEIRGRNAYLLHTALMEFPGQSGIVAIGIHAGTGYEDCSPEFVDVMRRSFELHTGGAIDVVAPFLHWTKQEVYGLAARLRVPFEETYSCEAANTPCNRCRSCIDRQSFPV